MIIRRAEPPDHPAWARLLHRLHGGQPVEAFEAELARFTTLPEPYVAFLALDDRGEAIGMIDARIRNYAEGAPNLRAAYLEDLWVDEAHRRSGIALALLRAVEAWARTEGLDWLGSDTGTGNLASRDWHLAAGFNEVERITVFGKPLGKPSDPGG